VQKDGLTCCTDTVPSGVRYWRVRAVETAATPRGGRSPPEKPRGTAEWRYVKRAAAGAGSIPENAKHFNGGRPAPAAAGLEPARVCVPFRPDPAAVDFDAWARPGRSLHFAGKTLSCTPAPGATPGWWNGRHKGLKIILTLLSLVRPGPLASSFPMKSGLSHRRG